MEKASLKTAALGEAGLRITRVEFGAWAIGGGGWEFGWGPQDDDESMAALHRAFDSGVNWVDTAAVYGLGHSEEVVARALRGRSGARPYVFTKCGLVWDEARNVSTVIRGESIRRECEASLRRLKVDAIDLYQIHWPTDDIADIDEGWGAMAELQREGKVRWIGVSNFDVEQMRRAQAIAPITSLQPPYSMLRREIEAEILPYASEHDIGVLVYGALAHGLLTGAIDRGATFAPDDWRSSHPMFAGEALEHELDVVDALRRFAEERGHSVSQLAIAWALSHPAVHVAIVGSRHRRHIADSIGALELHLSDADVAELDRILGAAGAVSVGGPAPEAMP